MELPVSLGGFKQIQMELLFPICVFSPGSLLTDAWLGVRSCPKGTNECPGVVSGVTRSVLHPGICSTRRSQRTRGQGVGRYVKPGIKNKEQSEGIAQEPGRKAAQAPSSDPDGLFVLMY